MNDERPVKISQPIPKLQAFLVFGTIMSYIGFRHEVVDLLQHLSKKTRDYYRSEHKRRLHTFFVDTNVPKVPRLELRDYFESCKNCFPEEWFIRRRLMANKVHNWCGTH